MSGLSLPKRCIASEYLHERHVIHRDIKLENILLDGEGYVRVTDFNVAKLIEERRTFSMKGTLFCMAPAQRSHSTMRASPQQLRGCRVPPFRPLR